MTPRYGRELRRAWLTIGDVGDLDEAVPSLPIVREAPQGFLDEGAGFAAPAALLSLPIVDGLPHRAVPGRGGMGEVYDSETEDEMPTSFATVEAEALSLSPEERVSLADHLLASVSNHRGVDEAWGAEVERRLVEVESGRMPLSPLEEVIRRARKALS